MKRSLITLGLSLSLISNAAGNIANQDGSEHPKPQVQSSQSLDDLTSKYFRQGGFLDIPDINYIIDDDKSTIPYFLDEGDVVWPMPGSLSWLPNCDAKSFRAFKTYWVEEMTSNLLQNIDQKKWPSVIDKLRANLGKAHDVMTDILSGSDKPLSWGASVRKYDELNIYEIPLGCGEVFRFGEYKK